MYTHTLAQRDEETGHWLIHCERSMNSKTEEQGTEAQAWVVSDWCTSTPSIPALQASVYCAVLLEKG